MSETLHEPQVAEPAETSEMKDIVTDYLDRIGKVPLLQADEEAELAKRIEAGQMAEAILRGEVESGISATQEELEWLAKDGQQAKEHLINANLRLAVSVASKYRMKAKSKGNGMSHADLIQEGNIGLVNAVEKFDHEKGLKFSNHATWWIRDAVTRSITWQAREIRIPRNKEAELDKVNTAKSKLLGDLNRQPTDAEIAYEAGMGITKYTVLTNLEPQIVSLNQPIVDEEREKELESVLEPRNEPTMEEQIEEILLAEEIERWLSSRDVNDPEVRSELEAWLSNQFSIEA